MKNIWSDFKQSVCSKRIVCHGAGNNAFSMLMNDDFAQFYDYILFFVDSDKAKWGKKIGSFDIRNTSDIDNISDDIIVIITISEFSAIGKEYENKRIEWYPWIEMVKNIIYYKLLNATNNRAVLFNTPDYANLGDHAIAIAEKNFLSKFYDEIIEIGSSNCTNDMLKMISDCIGTDEIVYVQGGGNMGSLWRTCENNIRRVVNVFKNNKIIIFPQSVYYGDSIEEQKYLMQSKEIYNGHADLLLCLRERMSKDYADNCFTCKTLLLPDMVMYMKYLSSKNSRNGFGVLLREDKEKILSNGMQEIVLSAINKMKKPVRTITHHRTDGYLQRNQRLREALNEYEKCELIITDRLHGMIFAYVTGTPCIAFDNNYHKISEVYKAWIGECGNIVILNMISEQLFIETANGLIGKERTINTKIEGKFKRLEKIIKVARGIEHVYD